MKIATVDLARLRSARSVSVSECGGFNVLIGQNNAGKSTVLTGISAFFGCLGDSLVKLTPPIGRELDHFDRDLEHQITVALTFTLDAPELERLVSRVMAEAPQLKEAADAISAAAQLLVRIVAGTDGAYVEDIRLIHNGDADKTLLAVPSQAAAELVANARAARDSHSEEATLKTVIDDVDRSMWPRIREMGRIDYLTRSSMSPRVRDMLNRLLSTAETYEEFREEVARLAADAAGRAHEAEAKPLETPVRTFGGEQTTIPGYALAIIGDLRDLQVLYLRERREPIGQGEAMKLLRLKMRRGGPERLSAIQQTVSDLLGVSIDAFQRDERTSREQAEMDVDNFLAEVNGAGIREALRIILDVEFEKPAILLIEEPEIHLHPALETALMQYLRRISDHTQIFISTHSTNFLDSAEMRNVYLVARREGETFVERLTSEDAEIELPRELGIRLSSLFMFDRLVFVEGPTDEAVLRVLAATLRLNLSRANVGFVAIGGARNFAYFAAETTLGFLTRRRVEMWFVLDRDERGDADVARLEDLGGPNATVHVLARRELENYLASPAAIAQFIGDKRALGRLDGGVPPVKDVEASLLEAAEELKGLAIAKHAEAALCRPAYPPRLAEDGVGNVSQQLYDTLKELADEIAARAESVDATVEAIRESIDAVWAAERLGLCPGDVLLDTVCQSYGVRYRKNRGDGARLAAHVSGQAIPEELASLLRAVGG